MIKGYWLAQEKPALLQIKEGLGEIIGIITLTVITEEIIIIIKKLKKLTV